MPEIWDALPIAVLLALFLTSSPAQALGTTSDCTVSTDAPSGYYTAECDGGGASPVCADQMGGVFACGLAQISGCAGANNGKLTVVQDFGNASNHDFSAWGECNGTTFCCVFDDDQSPVSSVIANGTSGNDEIHFDYGHDVPDVIFDDDLAPHDTGWLKGFMYAGAGNDTLEGSHFADPNAVYRDNLYGENGNDLIDGNHDGDWMAGGGGHDTMKGDQDNDTLVGGPGNDIMTGSLGDDYICDDAYAGATCAGDAIHLFIGSEGNDTLFYGDTGAPCGATSKMDTTAVAPDTFQSDGGTGTNHCGDTDVWTQAQLPLIGSCTNDLTTMPSACADPN